MKETKYIYFHRPTKKWVWIERDYDYPWLHFMPKFHPSYLFDNKEEIERTLKESKDLRSLSNYGKDNFLEFNLIKVEIEYKLPK